MALMFGVMRIVNVSHGDLVILLSLIGISLAYYGVAGRWRAALGFATAKLFVLPTLVLAVAHWGFGIGGLPALGCQGCDEARLAE